jgi:nucleotide-binding universal stress UspA family protein
MLHFDREHFLDQERDDASERRLLVGIDAPITTATMYALHTAGKFFAPSWVHSRFLLLHVIPVPAGGGRYSPPVPLTPTLEQRKQAGEALRAACAALQAHGIPRSHLETLVRVGAPVDELVRVATQLHIDCLVLGSRGHSPGQQLRRLLMGSTSHCVLRRASCPVLVVMLPHSRRPADLVAWYEAALKQALHDHPTALFTFTAAEVASRFLPGAVPTAGRKERRAAERALEHLVQVGVLCRWDAQGEVHYVND